MRFRELSEGKGVSNFKGVRQYALSVFDQKFDKLYPAGKITFTLPNTSIRVTIHVGPGLTDKWIEPKRWGQPYTVTINSDDRSQSQMRQVLTHEITHLSQVHNRAMNHADRLLRQYSQQHGIMSDWEARGRFHRQNPIEQEARLAEVLQLMLDGEIERAGEELWWEADYFQFSRRDWLRKAVAFGITPAVIRATEQAYRTVVAKHRGYLTSRPDIADKVQDRLARQTGVEHMLTP